MLVTIDVGNSNITIGLFKGDSIKGTFRMTTKIPRTSDEYGIFFTDLLTARNIQVKEVQAVIIASVVPDVMHSLTSGIWKYLHVKPIIVGPGIKTGIKLATENPREMGADRIVDAVAAYELYGGPVLVIDFGTATTHDLVLGDGSLVAGVTSPGIRISANALWNNAAKLPEIEIRKPDSILAKNTVTSMQAGLIYGCIGQTEYIIRKMQEEAGLEEMKVVATGGLGKIISKETTAIHEYDPDLTLKGLKLIYEKQGK
ncbi:MAG: type III pantothenate kinase [Lachnospiraceae bacterium]|nr:type III pantothenate kinase [Lachnospiraceae bacterium]MBP3506087.1 type III pantothenate kinase [Lachnospiraceae bacterium]